MLGGPHLHIQAAGTGTIITDGYTTVEVDDHELAEAMMGRLDQTSRLDTAQQELLSIMP